MNITKKIGTNSWGMYFNPSKFSFQDFKNHWDKDISSINNVGIKTIRIGYTYYDDGLNADGTYNFERLDYAINSAKEKGMKIILPIWFVDDGITDPSSLNYQNYLSKFLDMIEKIVIRYAGKCIYYEAIDEAASGGHFWLNQSITNAILDDVVSVNTSFYNFIKKYDETAFFINGDFASDSSSVDYVISQGMLKFGDFVSFHPYMTNPETIYANAAQKSYLDKLRLSGLKLSATEFGFGVPSAFTGDNTREQQTYKMLREIFVLDMIGVEDIVQFTMESSDAAWRLQNDDGSLNDTGNAVKNLISTLDGYSFKERIYSSEDDYILKYVKNGSNDIFVYWTTIDNHSFQKYNLTNTPQFYFSNTASNYERINKWLLGDEVTLSRLNDIENELYSLREQTEKLKQITTEKSKSQVPLLKSKNVFAEINTFSQPINGFFSPRKATFTDFADVVKNSTKYNGFWDTSSNAVLNGPMADCTYSSVIIISSIAGTAGTIYLNHYGYKNVDCYITNFSGGNITGWKKINFS